MLWGQRTQQSWPTSYRAQDPCRGGRNAWGWIKKVQIAKRYRREQSCPQPTEIIRRKGGMPLKIASQGISRKKDQYSGPAIGAWWRSNSRRSCHLHIKCPHLTIWSHSWENDPWIVLPWLLQLTEGWGRWQMGQALK